MYKIKLPDCNAGIGKLVFIGSSERDQLLYGTLGVLFFHWFMPEIISSLSLSLGVKLPEK